MQEHLLLLFGLPSLFAGARATVSGAIAIAFDLGMSEVLIGLAVLTA